FWLLFRRLEKVTRRKGGTPISNTHTNGYTHNPPKAWPAQRPPRFTAQKKAPTNEPGLSHDSSSKHQNRLISA
ncbi:hypothetical protein ACW9H0_28275, partial [Pseudomonas monsensis]